MNPLRRFASTTSIRSIVRRTTVSEPAVASTPRMKGPLVSWTSRLYPDGRARSTPATCISQPATAAALARTSSRWHGFRFCGIMDEPVHRSWGMRK